LTCAVGGRIVKVIADLPRRSGRVMSSEHATEQVPLEAIREGDMLEDPTSGNWIKVTRTADGVYYGDGGEEIDSRFVEGLVNRQVRE
jgi:hypothetical protein